MRWHGTIKLGHQRPAALHATPARAIGGKPHTKLYRKEEPCIWQSGKKIPHRNTSFFCSFLVSEWQKDMFETKGIKTWSCQLPSCKWDKKTTHFSSHLSFVTVKECDTHVSLLMPPLKHLLSLSRLPTHPRLPLLPPFFPSWCLFFICSDDSTHTVSWRLLLSQQCWDGTYKDFNIFFIVLHSMIHSLLGDLWIYAECFKSSPVAQTLFWTE